MDNSSIGAIKKSFAEPQNVKRKDFAQAYFKYTGLNKNAPATANLQN